MRIEHIGDATLILADCMDIMRDMPDKAFDLAIVDPPYGVGCGIGERSFNAGYKMPYNGKTWDSTRPLPMYFEELMRVSENQIIWGGNYFSDLLPASRCWIFWDKLKAVENYADGELAWTSFDKVSRCFEYVWVGNKYGLPGHEQGVGKLRRKDVNCRQVRPPGSRPGLALAGVGSASRKLVRKCSSPHR